MIDEVILQTSNTSDDDEQTNVEDPLGLLDTMDAMEWAKEFVRIKEEGDLKVDVEWMMTWFANAIMTGYDTAHRQMGKNMQILSHFNVGDKIESTIGEGGGTEVFIDDYGHIQPFSYLNDYDPTHFRICKENNDE